MKKIPLIDISVPLAGIEAAVADGFLPADDAARARTLTSALVGDLNRLTVAINATMGIQMAEAMDGITSEEATEKLALREKEVTSLVSKLFEDHLGTVLNLVFSTAHRTIFKPGFGLEMDARANEQVEAK